MWARLRNLIRGFLGLFIKGLEQAAPEAIIEAEKERLQRAVAMWNTNLARQAGMVSRLTEQVKRQRAEVEGLTAKVTAHLKVGNRDAARQYVVRFNQVKQDLAENETQLKDAERMYQDYLAQRDAAVREARARLEAASRTLSKVQMAEAQAELAEIASATSFDVAGSGATLERLEEGLGERLADARGKVRVAGDSMDTTQVKVQEAEQDALADSMLAEFAAAQGIDLPAGFIEEPPAVEKTMGPAPSEATPEAAPPVPEAPAAEEATAGPG